MSTRPFHFHYLCVHGHFYQPPRGNPVTGEIGVEPSAGEYENWNARINAESYHPNAQIGNFDRISFDVGEALMQWLKAHAPDTYKRIVKADSLHQQRKKVGNAIGNPFDDVILPLLRHRDKYTQLSWGRAAFRHHFGHDPQGVWLPEMAIDPETLQIVEALAYRYTIVSEGQIEGQVEGSGPYWVELPNDRRLAVFVRNDELSNDLSFNIRAVGGAGHWARNKLAGRSSQKGLLTLLATGGETFGHHHLGEERFLHWLLDHEAPAVGFRVLTLNEFFGNFSPRHTIQLKPFSSWSNTYSITQWTTGYNAWKSALLRALDNLASDLHELYADVVRPLHVDPWEIRNAYVAVCLGEIEGPEFLAEFAPGLDTETEARILALLSAERYLLRSYISNAFFVADFDGLEPRYSIANAACAAYIAEQATGQRLGARFRNDLYLVCSENSPLNGSQVYDSVVEEYLTPRPEEEGAAQPDDDAEEEAAQGSAG